MEVSEDLLQYIWAQRRYRMPLYDLDGHRVEVLDPGSRNRDAGPDFFNARIWVGGLVWAGNVEIHRKASDWFLHRHHRDPAYNNVILHLVLEADCVARNAAGRQISTVVMECEPGILMKIRGILDQRGTIACLPWLAEVEVSGWTSWLERLGMERLEARAAWIRRLLEKERGDWQEVFFRVLGRAFGEKANALPFEMLTRSAPLRILCRLKPDRLALEALLFGQSGMLHQPNFRAGCGPEGGSCPDAARGDQFAPRHPAMDAYQHRLRSCYQRLRDPTLGKPLDPHLWKFLRLRPANFPTLRISQLADLLYRHRYYLPIGKDLSGWIQDFRQRPYRASAYWDARYRFGQSGSPKTKCLGAARADILMINAILPVHWAWYRYQDLDINHLLEVFHQLKPEKNHIIANWEASGIEVGNAFQSQALIQLTEKYCKFKRCLSCYAGNQIISRRGQKG